LEQTNGGKSGELMLDMQVTEEDISDLLQRITSATYNVGGYSLGESSQGLGYSNLIYIHLQLKEYERNIDPLKVNMFFLEEPESHMHPQMQHVFIKYLINQYQLKSQGLVTTHSNEIVRSAGISHLRILRRTENYSSNLYDLSLLLDELKQSEVSNDTLLVDFFDWFFEIGYSEIVFADKVIFYEGDTERLFLRKIMTLDKYKELSQQYIAFIQVGGAYAKNYENILENYSEYVKEELFYNGIVVVSKSENLDESQFIEIKNALNINRDIKFPFKHYSKWDNETWEYIFSTTGIFLETDNKLTLKFKVNKKQPEKKLEQYTLKNIGVTSLDKLSYTLLYLMSNKVGKVERVKGNLTIQGNNYKFDLVGNNYEITGNNNSLGNNAVVIGTNLNRDIIEKLFEN